MSLLPARETLNERLLDCFSGASYALPALLRLLDVVESRDVETAAVECRVEPKLLVNPDFVQEWAATPEKLFMLVMHELHHVLLGHTRIFPRVGPVDNLVFDAVINSLLCRMFPQVEYVSFFTDFYAEGQLPHCLLRPPGDWTPQGSWSLPEVLTAPQLRPLAEVYRGLYSSKGAGYHELYQALRELVAEGLAVQAVLMGDHRSETLGQTSSGGLLGERSPLLFDIVREIVEHWPQPPNPLTGRSLADLLKQARVTLRKNPSNRAVLRGLLQKVAGRNGGTSRRRDWLPDPTTILGPIPTFDRKSLVLCALGAQPILHNQQLEIKQRRLAGERVHVYLDVSGSIGHLKGALYGAVLDCREFVHPVILLALMA
jgi:hypothetical protein